MTFIPTTYGDIDESALVKMTGTSETDDAVITWVEYRFVGRDEIVHRSVHATIKATAAAFAKSDLF